MYESDPQHAAFGERQPQGHGGPWYGVYPAVVADHQDPDGEGRVQVRLPWCPDAEGGDYAVWARLATMMGGADRGSWFVPETDDEVLVAFEAGDPRRPYVVGALWNGRDAPPATMDADNSVKRLRSRNGLQITMEDRDGQERLQLETPAGQRLTLEDGPGTVRIEDSNGNSVELAPDGISLQAAAKVTVSASTVDVSAGMVNVNAGMSKFSGVVQADTVITNTVISATYTPGAGNIW